MPAQCMPTANATASITRKPSFEIGRKMTIPCCCDRPTPNPALSSGEHEALRQRVLEARNLLNHVLDEAAHNDIAVEVRLLQVMNVGAARRGIPHHFLVEALPVKTPEEIEHEERAQLAALKFKYENPLGAILRTGVQS